MDMPNTGTSDRRASDRVRSFLRAQIIFNNRMSTIDCIIKNISPTGARVALNETLAVPSEFDIYIPQRGRSHHARLTWRDKDSIGIDFLDTPLSRRRLAAGRCRAMGGRSAAPRTRSSERGIEGPHPSSSTRGSKISARIPTTSSDRAPPPTCARAIRSISTTRPSCNVTRRFIRAARSHCYGSRAARRGPSASTKVSSALDDVIGGRRIEISGRLVGKQNPGPFGDRAGDRDALLLAARQLRRPMRRPRGEAEIVEQASACARAPAWRERPCDHLRQHDIFERREFRQQMMELIDEADARRAAAPCARRPACDVVGSLPIRLRRRPAAPSRPAMCRSVDLPAPDCATSATDWPGNSAKSAPRSTVERRRRPACSGARSLRAEGRVASCHS